MDRRPQAPGVRRVALLMGLLVLGVLIASAVSAAIPGMDAILADAPIVLLSLVAMTLVVLLGTLRRGP